MRRRRGAVGRVTCLDDADVLAASKRAQGQIAALIERIVALEPIS